jgi:hypothetical protein
VDRGIRIVRLRKHVFQPYRLMFKDLKVKRRSSHYDASSKKRRALNILKHCFLGRGGRLSFFLGCIWNLTPGGKAKYMCIDTINTFLMVNINTKFCFLKCRVMLCGRKMSWFRRNCCLRCWKSLVYSKPVVAHYMASHHRRS